MYPAEKMRDKDWVHKMGHAPSIMDYSRFNYVAQPEDGIAVEDLVPRIGPYDIWATQWGYTPIPDAKTPEDEKPTLDGWAREQDKTPVAALLHRRRSRLRSRRAHRSRGRRRRHQVHRRRPQEPAARGQDAHARHHRQARRTV